MNTFEVSHIINHQIKTTLGFRLLLVRMAIIKKDMMTNASKDMGKEEPMVIVLGISNLYSHCGNQYGVSSKGTRSRSTTT